MRTRIKVSYWEKESDVKEKIEEKELTWANVNTEDPEEMERFRRQQEKRAGERIRKSVKELQDLGIMDEEGRRVKKELPPDMQPGSETDV